MTLEPFYQILKFGYVTAYDALLKKLPTELISNIFTVIINPSIYFTNVVWEKLFNPLIWILAVYLLLKLFVRIKEFFFEPLNIIRLLGDVGYLDELGVSGRKGKTNSQNKAAIVAAVMKRRKPGKVPPVYPNGWFVILESRELGKKDVRSVFSLGMNLAVFRGEDGKVHAIDAYCPHMGANLAAGGAVKNNCLECPFHGWLFRGEDGKCVHVPYCEDEHITESAKVKTYCIMERNGFILLWHHAEGCDPLWEPPIIVEIEDKIWKYCGRTEHIVNCHIEEFSENGADAAHLTLVHGPVITAGVELQYMRNKFWSFIHHEWTACWDQKTDSGCKHISLLNLSHKLILFGKHIPILDANVKGFQIGPGVVHLFMEGRFFGKAAYMQTVTPIEPLVQRVIHHIYINKQCPTIFAKFLLYGVAIMIDRDIMVWNNKQYISKPLLLRSKEDSMIGRHRKWYSQFYSENSPRLENLQHKKDW